MQALVNRSNPHVISHTDNSVTVSVGVKVYLRDLVKVGYVTACRGRTHNAFMYVFTGLGPADEVIERSRDFTMLDPVAGENSGDRIVVVNPACGQGPMLVRLHRWKSKIYSSPVLALH